MNHVDTSTETIQLEFTAAADAIGIEPEQPIQSPQSAEKMAAMEEAEREAQIAIAQEMMNATLKLTLGAMINVTVDNQHTQEASRAYAILIIKYFPGGIFGLLDRYKEELGAVTATVMLINVVNKAKAEQVKQEEEEAAKAATLKKSAPTATGCFKFGEEPETEQGEHANG